jgi:hypothetical protein
MHHLTHAHNLGALVAVWISVFTAVGAGVWVAMMGNKPDEE